MSEEEKLCSNCQRRRIGPYSSEYCSVCGLTSDTDPDAEVHKSPSLDNLNMKLEWREKYMRGLEDSNATLRAELNHCQMLLMARVTKDTDRLQ